MGTEIIMQSLNDNQFLTDDNRIAIYNGINDVYKLISQSYKIDIDLSNFSSLLENIKLVDVEQSDSYYSYSSNDNILVRKKTDDEYMIYDFYESILKIMSQKYNTKTDKYQSGLLLEDEKGTHNTVLNNELISKLTTLITGYSDRKRNDSMDSMDGTSIKDVIVKDICDIISYQDLIAKFFAADGDGLFDFISEKIGVEQTMDFISIVDNCDKEIEDEGHKIKIAKRQKYDRYITILKELSLETIPTL